jgi:hypothetical protein
VVGAWHVRPLHSAREALPNVVLISKTPESCGGQHCAGTGRTGEEAEDSRWQRHTPQRSSPVTGCSAVSCSSSRRSWTPELALHPLRPLCCGRAHGVRSAVDSHTLKFSYDQYPPISLSHAAADRHLALGVQGNVTSPRPLVLGISRHQPRIPVELCTRLQ